MTNIKPIIPYLRSVDYKPPLGYLYEGAVTSGTMLSLTDSSANWEIDEWIGKAIKIKRNGGSDFENAIILNNTEDTLIFAGAGSQIITVEIPVVLNRNDELVPAIRKVGTGGVFSLTAGSTFKVFEF
jgi:hypothetical protein